MAGDQSDQLASPDERLREQMWVVWRVHVHVRTCISGTGIEVWSSIESLFARRGEMTSSDSSVSTIETNSPHRN